MSSLTQLDLPAHMGDATHRIRWTEAEHALFEAGLNLYGHGRGGPKWIAIAEHVGTRNFFQVKYHAKNYFRKLRLAEAAAEQQEMLDRWQQYMAFQRVRFAEAAAVAPQSEHAARPAIDGSVSPILVDVPRLSPLCSRFPLQQRPPPLSHSPACRDLRLILCDNVFRASLTHWHATANAAERRMLVLRRRRGDEVLCRAQSAPCTALLFPLFGSC